MTAQKVNAGQACVELACTNIASGSASAHCGESWPDAKASPPGALVVTYEGPDCKGEASLKQWYAPMCISLGGNTGVSGIGSTRTGCVGGKYGVQTFSQQNCEGSPTISVDTGFSGCVSSPQASFGYYCDRDASPAFTVIASVAMVALGLVLAL